MVIVDAWVEGAMCSVHAWLTPIKLCIILSDNKELTICHYEPFCTAFYENFRIEKSYSIDQIHVWAQK